MMGACVEVVDGQVGQTRGVFEEAHVRLHQAPHVRYLSRRQVGEISPKSPQGLRILQVHGNRFSGCINPFPVISTTLVLGCGQETYQGCCPVPFIPL